MSFIFWMDLFGSISAFGCLLFSIWQRDIFAAAGWWMAAFGYAALTVGHA